MDWNDGAGLFVLWNNLTYENLMVYYSMSVVDGTLFAGIQQKGR
jgi:hypothetical protein